LQRLKKTAFLLVGLISLDGLIWLAL
jgi:hypothetical protein